MAQESTHDWHDWQSGLDAVGLQVPSVPAVLAPGRGRACLEGG